MSNLDIMVCADELKNIIGSRVEKIYQLEELFLFKLHSKKNERLDLLIEPGRRVHLTRREYEPPKEPSPFAMLLRKHLCGLHLTAVGQPDFERILELRFEGPEKRILIAELFGGGNLILCDEDIKIIQPLTTKVWRHRAIKAGEKYHYPPSKGLDIRKLTAGDLSMALLGAKDVVRGLATNLNIGGELAEEICARAEIDGRTPPNALTSEKIQKIMGVAAEILTGKLSPRIIYENGDPVTVVPFDFLIYKGKRADLFDSFNEALDEYFNIALIQEKALKKRISLEMEIERVRARIAQQESLIDEFRKKASEQKIQADLIVGNHAFLDSILKKLAGLRKAEGWQKAISAWKGEKEKGEDWAIAVKDVQPEKARLIVEIDGQLIPLDLRLSAFENAKLMYEKYKKLMEKEKGAREALEKTEKELQELIEKSEFKIPPLKVRKVRKLKWFEKFKWFISSDGFLVIAGRDAATNREVVEKHMEMKDIYLHADIVGAPHVIIKTQGKEVPENTLREAAEFAAMHSRAWREGLGSIEVYWVLPEQVSKQAPPGEYLPKGSYVIKGKRNYIKVPLKSAVGVMSVNDEKMVICGPISAVEKHSSFMIKIAPGGTKKSDLAKVIQFKLKNFGLDISTDEIMRILPPGKGDIVE